MKKTAIIYHYLAFYRLPIFSEMMRSKTVNFNFISGVSSEINIKKIDFELSNVDISEGGLRWSVVENIWMFRKKFLWQKGIIKIAFDKSFDSYIFLGSPYHLSTWVGGVVARLRGKKVYFWMHGVYRTKLKRVDYIKLFVFYKIANGCFLYGNRSRKILLENKVYKPENIHVIYNSLDYEKSKRFDRNYSVEKIKEHRLNYFNSNIPTIIFIGRLNKIKRVDLLIQAQEKLKVKRGKPIFNLLVIGDGEEKENLIKLVEKNNLIKEVKFLGGIYNELKIANLLKYSELCVTPGEVGLTAIHSLSYGTPVISHDNLDIQMPEVEAIRRFETGDLYEHNNLQSLVSCIDKWFSIYPIKSREIEANCYSQIDRFYNPDYQMKVFDQCFK